MAVQRMAEMAHFLEYQPTDANYWRSIILFGRNVASYKFALAQSLLGFRERGNDLVTMDELALPFARHLCTHIAQAPKQSTSPSSRFLDSCRQFNAGEISESELQDITRRIGFNNVIDAFHVVNQAPINLRFFEDERRLNGGIRLTDHLYKLHETNDGPGLGEEVEARWRLVETAWDLGMARQLIAVEHDPERQILTARKQNRRITVTSSRAALNGYQKGCCFYCFAPITLTSGDPALADIDHFIPHTAASSLPGLMVNGVWNLVLACRTCNRGPTGKFARVPSTALLGRLHRRNEFLIGSHHPLRETLIAQTGASEQERRGFLQARHSEASALLIHQWQPPDCGDRAL